MVYGNILIKSDFLIQMLSPFSPDPVKSGLRVEMLLPAHPFQDISCNFTNY